MSNEDNHVMSVQYKRKRVRYFIPRALLAKLIHRGDIVEITPRPVVPNWYIGDEIQSDVEENLFQ